MWLSRDAFEELKRTRQTRWSADTVTMLSHLAVLTVEQMAQLDEVTQGHEIMLRAEPDLVDFDLYVNGQKQRYQTIQAFDDLGNEYIILDEAQNATTAQMKMFLTRLGLNSQVVITGDKTQIDLPKSEESGLLQVERILAGIEGISIVYLDARDVIRHRLVKDIIRAYSRETEEETQ